MGELEGSNNTSADMSYLDVDSLHFTSKLENLVLDLSILERRRSSSRSSVNL